MDHFSYKEGILHAEEVSIQEIAKEVGTPFYIYSTATLRRHFDLFESALSGVDHLICYAVKAASNQAILKHWQNLVLEWTLFLVVNINEPETLV